GSRLEGVSPPCHLVHCRLCLPGGRKGHFSPLESALRYDRRNACPSRKLPAAGCCPFALSVTYQTRLRLCHVKSHSASPPYSTDAHAAANLDQIEEIDHMFDAVGLGMANTAKTIGVALIAVIIAVSLVAPLGPIKAPQIVSHCHLEGG